MPSLMIVRESFLMWLWAHFFSGMAFFCAVKESASFWLFFLFQVVLSAGVLSLVFVGGVQMCHSARTSSQPHRLVPLANGMSQLALTLTLLMIAVILPMLAQLRYQSLSYKRIVPWSSFYFVMHSCSIKIPPNFQNHATWLKWLLWHYSLLYWHNTLCSIDKSLHSSSSRNAA